MSSTFPLALANPTTVEELVRRISILPATIAGDRATRISSIASPGEAAEGSIVFVEGSASQVDQHIRSSRASVFVAACSRPADDSRSFIQTTDPRTWYIAALSILFPQVEPLLISEDARISRTASLGKNISVGRFSVIGDNVTIGDDARVGNHVVIHRGCTIGARCVIQDHSIIGSTGMAYHRDRESHLHYFPHMGSVRIGDEVEIGVGCTIVRGMMNDTTVGSGTKIGNYVNIGHNCVVGENCWISSQVLLCGRVELQDDARLAVSVSISDHLLIGRGAMVGLGSVVTKTVPPNGKVFGVPAKSLPTMKSL